MTNLLPANPNPNSTEFKTCSKCKSSKPISEFYLTSTTKRYHSWCKACEIEYTKAYLKSDRGKKATKKWRQNNPGKVNAWYRTDRKNHPRRHASYDLKKRIGITLADKEEKFYLQGERCAICGTDTPNTKKIWFADHCHKTKQFRGVLCGRCNSVLGYALDSPAILIRAAVYLLNNSQLRDELVERKNDEFAPVSEFD